MKMKTVMEIGQIFHKLPTIERNHTDWNEVVFAAIKLDIKKLLPKTYRKWSLVECDENYGISRNQNSIEILYVNTAHSCEMRFEISSTMGRTTKDGYAYFESQWTFGNKDEGIRQNWVIFRDASIATIKKDLDAGQKLIKK